LLLSTAYWGSSDSGPGWFHGSGVGRGCCPGAFYLEGVPGYAKAILRNTRQGIDGYTQGFSTGITGKDYDVFMDLLAMGIGS